MKIYVLDTDIAGFAQSEHPTVLAHVRQLREDDLLATTIITFGEDLGGWLPVCHRAQDGAARAKAYSRLMKGLDFYLQILSLPFTTDAAVIFDNLKMQKIRIGTNDLSIAAITLSVGGILVTRNSKDFQRIADLTLEDWTQ